MKSKQINLILSIILVTIFNINVVCMETECTPHTLVGNPLYYLDQAIMVENDFIKEFQSTDLEKECKSIHTSITEKRKKIKQMAQTLNLKSLIKQQDVLLAQSEKLEQKLQNIPSIALTKIYTSLTEKYEHIFPLFLLNECTKEIGNTETNDNCLLSRTYKPHYRNCFEKHASNLLIEKLQKSPNQPVTYTSFGCGGAFQDLIIITKALIQQPKALLTIHLIDGVNTPYTSAVDFLNHTHEIKVEQNFTFGSQLAEYEQYARDKEKHDPAIQNFTQEALKLQLLDLCLSTQAKYKQFLSWLNKQFSQATISLYVHNQASNYCNFINENKCSHADVVTTVDIDDETSKETHSIQDYTALCLTTLTNNPTSVNAWLRKTNENSVGISAISLSSSDKTPLILKINTSDLL
jgi:hypothetical protein